MSKVVGVDRKKAISELRKYHQETFDALGIPNAIYIPKMAHYVKGVQGVHMGFFESEMNHDQDIYTEKISINMESEDPDRTLYRIRANPHFREEYFTQETIEGKAVKYFVEVEEMEIIPRATKKVAQRIKVKQDQPMVIDNDPDLDLPMEQMTLRDYACLKLGVPGSFKPWLNELIKKSKKQ